MLIPGFAAVVLGTSGFAYMASNNVPDSYAGDGQGDIAGYNVSNIDYDVSGDGSIYAVHFAIDNASNEAQTHAFIVKGDGSQVSYGHCASEGPKFGYAFRCDTNGGAEATVGQAEGLRVLGAQ